MSLYLFFFHLNILLAVGIFLSNKISCGTLIFLIHNTWSTALDDTEQRAPVFRNVTSSPCSLRPWQHLRHFLWTFGPWETKFEIHTLKPFSFLYHCIYLHKKSSAAVTFLMKQFWQPKWRRIFHLPLLADVATSEHHENVSPKCLPLVLPLPVFFQGWADKTSVITMTLTYLDSISPSPKNIPRLFPHQTDSQMCTTSVNASWSYLSLLTPGSHVTHLQFSFSFSDKTRFCQHWHFSITMYFSDSPIESKWSLAPFNSDIAFGSHTGVCHCSFYFGGSGMHKAWKAMLCQSST